MSLYVTDMNKGTQNVYLRRFNSSSKCFRLAITSRSFDTFNYPASTRATQRRMDGTLLNNELAGLWKKALGSQSEGTIPAYSATIVNKPGRHEYSISTV